MAAPIQFKKTSLKSAVQKMQQSSGIALTQTGLPSEIDTRLSLDSQAKMTPQERNKNINDRSLRESKLPSYFVTSSLISLFSWKEMQRIAGQIRIDNSKNRDKGSVNDPRMGVINFNHRCGYCLLVDCPGHYGLISFRTKVYNPVFIREIVSVLNCTCYGCGKLLITKELLETKKNLPAGIDRLPELEKYCKDLPCLNNNENLPGGEITKCKKRVYLATDIKEEGKIYYKTGKDKEEIKNCPPILLSVNEAYETLRKIKDATPLGFSRGSRPRDMILRGVLVPPVIARPPAERGGTIKDDDLTDMYITLARKLETQDLTPDNESIQIYKTLRQIFFRTEGIKAGPKSFVSITERIQGKNALMRALLMGKRNDYCGRTVAGPESSIRFGEIRIPDIWATVLTRKERVTDFNINQVRQWMAEGKVTHIITQRSDLRRAFNQKVASTLRVGDRVERHLMDGDRIVVNRQPTLHNQSMMGFKVKLDKKLTIGSHLSYTTPMNLDFDGDEKNAWVPQDLEVEAEIEFLLNVTENLISSENNRPTMGLVMNSTTGVFLLTHPAVRINEELFNELIGMMEPRPALRTLDTRLKRYGVHPRSGRALFSALLPDDFYFLQGEVMIMEGILFSGRLKKAQVGTVHRSIIQELHHKYGSARAAQFLTEAPWVLNKWIMERGFTVGLRDIVNFGMDEVKGEYDKSKAIIDSEMAKIIVSLQALGEKVDDPLEEAYRERQVIGLVDVAEKVGLKIATDILDQKESEDSPVGANSIGVMTSHGAGTKGAVANIGSMMGVIGQQYYRNRRLEPTLSGGTRLLPAFDKNDSQPKARAFIESSYFRGLSATELFFLQAGGREGLLDTALNTAETGNLQRLMIKAFENIVIAYDGSVRNTIGTLFLPMYNCGYNISNMLAVGERNSVKVSSFIDLKAAIREANMKRGWVPAKTAAEIKARWGNKPPLPAAPPVTTRAGPLGSPPPLIYPHKYKITKYEKTRIIGTRAMQLSFNAPPHLLPHQLAGEIDPVKIATREYEEGRLEALYVIRRYADGTVEKVSPDRNNI